MATATLPATSKDLSRFWEHKTSQVRRFLNFAWLLEGIRPAFFAGCVVAMAAVLLVRRQPAWPGWLLVVLPCACAVVSLLVAVWLVRRRFISHAAARVEIESALGLHSGLSAAAAGVGSWPGSGRWSPAPWRLRWRRLLVLPLCSLCLVAASFLLPITAAPVKQQAPIVKPPALENVEAMLEALAETPQVDQESLQGVQEEAQQLGGQDPADWYSHASLEAADHLQAKMQAGMKSLGDGAAKLQSLLGRNAAEAGAAWNEQLAEALSALQGNVPGLNPELAKAMAGLDASKLKTLTPEQVKELSEQLGGAKSTARRLGKGKGEPGEEEEEGEQEGEGEGKDGEGLGQGGVSRGPGTGPLRFKAKPSQLHGKETEGLENDDFSRAAIGEALGTSAGEHDVDKEKNHRATSGGAATAGEGASATWRQQNVSPEERKRLQEFFK